MAQETQKVMTQGVVHITQPHDYFGLNIAKKPIFGFENAEKMLFNPVQSDGLQKPIIYMTPDVQYSERADMMIDKMPRDQWEYIRYAQLEMAGQFEDTLAYREKMGITTDRTLLLGLQYFMLGMLRYSNFNFIIDFNELNRISLKPTDEALRDLYILNAAALQNLNWAIIKKSTLDKVCPTLGRKQLLEALNLKNPPQYTQKDGDFYLRRYVYLRDQVLSNQSCRPWDYAPYETELTAQQLKDEFREIGAKCNQTAQERQN